MRRDLSLMSFSKGEVMADLIYLALGIGFFAATFALVYAFDRLGGRS
jgi:hypothetical protein